MNRRLHPLNRAPQRAPEPQPRRGDAQERQARLAALGRALLRLASAAHRRAANEKGARDDD